MKPNLGQVISGVAGLGLVLSGCQSRPDSTPVPTQEPTAIVSPTPTVTPVETKIVVSTPEPTEVIRDGYNHNMYSAEQINAIKTVLSRKLGQASGELDTIWNDMRFFDSGVFDPSTVNIDTEVMRYLKENKGNEVFTLDLRTKSSDVPVHLLGNGTSTKLKNFNGNEQALTITSGDMSYTWALSNVGNRYSLFQTTEPWFQANSNTTYLSDEKGRFYEDDVNYSLTPIITEDGVKIVLTVVDNKDISDGETGPQLKFFVIDESTATKEVSTVEANNRIDEEQQTEVLQIINDQFGGDNYSVINSMASVQGCYVSNEENWSLNENVKAYLDRRLGSEDAFVVLGDNNQYFKSDFLGDGVTAEVRCIDDRGVPGGCAYAKEGVEVSIKIGESRLNIGVTNDPQFGSTMYEYSEPWWTIAQIEAQLYGPNNGDDKYTLTPIVVGGNGKGKVKVLLTKFTLIEGKPAMAMYVMESR